MLPVFDGVDGFPEFQGASVLFVFVFLVFQVPVFAYLFDAEVGSVAEDQILDEDVEECFLLILGVWSVFVGAFVFVLFFESSECFELFRGEPLDHSLSPFSLSVVSSLFSCVCQ